MLKAKVREDSRFAPIISCSGVSFFRDSWVNVPLGFEVEAKACEFLTTKEFKDVKPVIEKEVKVKPKVEPEPVKDALDATEGAISFANDMKVELSWLPKGTGKNGKIVLEDVKDYLAQKAD